MLLFHQRRYILSNKEILIDGPAIEAEFVIERGLIQEIRLVPSDSAGLKWSVRASQAHPALEQLISQWMISYVQKRPIKAQWPLDWTQLSPFTCQTLTALLNVSFGNSLSYKQLAQVMGKEQGSRAVGSACGRNPFLLLVPCHRILTSENTLGGFSAGLELKKRLLSFENISYRR